MALLAELHDNGRSTERHALDADATLRTAEQAPVDILIVDLSATGCLFLCREPLEVGALVPIGITGVGKRIVRIVRVADGKYGAEFAPPLTPEDLAAVLAAPGSTIVPFPAMGGPTVARPAPPAVAKLPGSTRLLVTLGLIAVSWAGVIAIRLLLF